MNCDDRALSKAMLPPLSGSGFPFQTAVVAALKTTFPLEVEEEVAWRDDDGSHKFLDIVASRGQIKICVECKALRNEKLIFLLPQTEQRVSTDIYSIHAVHLSRVKDSTMRPVVLYGITDIGPLTPQSSYCVAQGQGRLLEREAQPLVRATEEYAKDRCRQFTEMASIACIPVLLTTASLFVAEYNALKISLTDGVYQARDEDLRQVPFVRFTKEFTSHGTTSTRIRTVIVAQAAALKELVDGIWGNLPWGGPKIADAGIAIYDSLSGEAPRR